MQGRNDHEPASIAQPYTSLFTYAWRPMSSLPMLIALVALAALDPARPMAGRLVDAHNGTPIAGAEITIVGQRGSVRTDSDGRFRWPITPPMPVQLIAVLPDGRVARPIRIGSANDAQELRSRQTRR